MHRGGILALLGLNDVDRWQDYNKKKKDLKKKAHIHDNMKNI